MMYGFRYPFMGVGMFIGMLFFILLIVGVIYLLYRGSGRDRENHRAMDILDEKFAAGEINEEEYIKRKKLLQDR